MQYQTFNLKAQIAKRIAEQSVTYVWTPVDFLDLGSRAGVDKALQRLVEAGKLRRIARGLYDQPRHNKLTAKSAAPDYRGVIDAVRRRDRIRVLVDGITAANALGFTNAVPARVVVHTDARSRSITLENLTIEFRLTAARRLYWAGRPGMNVVQALHWLRDSIAEHPSSISDRLIRLLKRDKSGVLAHDLRRGLYTLPGWMQDLLGDILFQIDDGDERVVHSKHLPATAFDADTYQAVERAN